MKNLVQLNENEFDQRVARIAHAVFQENLRNSHQPDERDEIIDQRAAAKLLGVTVASLITYKKKGIIPFLKVGRRVLYSKKELLFAVRKGNLKTAV
jgi:hypothetical protein